MFEKLKKAFSDFIRVVAEKELSESNLRRELRKLELLLISNDVAVEVARGLTSAISKELLGKRVKRFSDLSSLIRGILEQKLKEVLLIDKKIDLIKIVEERKRLNVEEMKKSGEWKPYIILFLGPNGSGKTTTIAKLAYLAKKHNLSPVLVASDTFRAGAIEQLERHAKKIGVTMIKRPYGSDPASVAYDAISHAKARKKDLILIDTAGRLGTNIDLMEEMKKIARVSKPDFKIFVADALSGNDLVIQAREFNKHVGIDGNILTKVDADVKGGAALTLTYTTNAPILYIGIGQKYSDLIPFNSDWFIKKILG